MADNLNNRNYILAKGNYFPIMIPLPQLKKGKYHD